MPLKAEVLGRYDHAADASKLLYAPLNQALTYRETRRYTVDFEGSDAECETFLGKVLSDGTSHELHLGEAPAIGGSSFVLDYGMKPGALDLEKETIVSYFNKLENPGFKLNSLKIQRRVYLFGAKPDEAKFLSERFVRDIVNPAVHHFEVIF